ncbi:hypothetical protein Tco_1404799 [Tanacetum coccineum]
MVEKLITSEFFDRLHDDDAVSLCCVGILQFVLLGLEDRCGVPDWILWLANDRDGWDKYPWGSYVWSTLYSQLRDANAFKTWILESFRVGANDYYKRHRRYPRIVAWSSKKKFYRHMIRGFFRGRLPTERLTPDENEARSDWWVSSRAYFDGRISEAERVPRHVNRQNHYEVPSELYREIEEQKRAVDEMLKKEAEREKAYEQMRSQATPSYGHNMATPNWQTPMLSHPGTSNWQTQMPSRSDTTNWQNTMP